MNSINFAHAHYSLAERGEFMASARGVAPGTTQHKILRSATRPLGSGIGLLGLHHWRKVLKGFYGVTVYTPTILKFPYITDVLFTRAILMNKVVLKEMSLSFNFNVAVTITMSSLCCSLHQFCHNSLPRTITKTASIRTCIIIRMYQIWG